MAQTMQSQSNHHGLPELAKYLISAVILLIGIGATIGLTLLRDPPGKKDSNALIPLVRTTSVAPFSGSLDMLVSGTVVPFREIKIAAEIGGKIINKYPECEAGNYVTRGTKLLEIDTEEYQIELSTIEREIDQAQKSLAEAEEEINGAQKNLELAKRDLELQKKEYDRSVRLKGVLSDSEMDEANRALLNSRTQLTTRENSLALLEAKKARMQSTLEVAESRRDKAKFNLERTVITAPDDGIIVQESVEQGDNVFPNSPLIIMEDTSHAEVRCNLTPSELNWLRRYALTPGEFDESERMLYRLPKSEVQIFETSDPDMVWTGILERFDGIGRDELTKSIPCRIVVPEPIAKYGQMQKALVRGMYVKCRIVIPADRASGNQQLASFPEAAVRPGNFVWVVRDKRLHRIDVSIVDRTSQTVDGKQQQVVVVSMIPESLKMGDQVVTTPLPQPIEGGPVLLEEDQVPNVPSETQTAGESSSQENTTHPASAVSETGGKT